jgi:hexulose-6-phosphate isomerase
MQGRLSPRLPDRLQAFPESSWAHEFELAASLEFDFIEWLLSEEANPLTSEAGRREIVATSRATGVPVRSVCAPLFLKMPLVGGSAQTRAAAVSRLRAAIAQAAAVGAGRLVLPLLEEAHVRRPELEDQAVAGIDACLDAVERHGVRLALELDLAGPACSRVLRRVGHPGVVSCYDVGNATAEGHDAAIDVLPVLDALGAVHVKDRLRGAASVRLGTGDTNFAGFFAVLRDARYGGDLTLEHWFDDPVADAREAHAFVSRGLAASGIDRRRG